MELIVRQKYIDWKGKNPEQMELLPASGSHRKYYRISGPEGNLLGVYNQSEEENAAYVSFTRQFREEGLPVPGLLHVCKEGTVYFVEDLGDTTLFSLLPEDGVFGDSLFSLYREVLRCLIAFQTAGGAQGLDYSHVYPVEEFDRRAMEWDLNHFKYFFLKLSGIEFSESLLQQDFERLTDFVASSGCKYFMYRDFQSRNIMVEDGKPWFIDFQGGRRGPLAYDVASLLYDAKADLPGTWRAALLEEYIREASGRIAGFDGEAFRKEFHACVLLRILQAMGTYGLRGFYERKPLFLKSVPYALRNLAVLLDSGRLPLRLPETERIIRALQASPLASFSKPGSERLKIKVGSFSFKQGLPPAEDAHGGGFVFDCRFLPNPGRLEEYKSLTGRSPEVRRYLAMQGEVPVFLQNCLQLLSPAIRNYLSRDFESLSILFGCTGGQHRSVYCAEEMARLLRENFDVEVRVRHWVHPE